MSAYSKAFRLDIWAVISALYKHYNVKSRTELTVDQLDEAIESYRVSIINNIL